MVFNFVKLKTIKIIDMKRLIALFSLTVLIYSCDSESKCSNTCQWANDGVCDDGGSGSTYNLCDLGTDCADCGAR